jgi:hypothetical protein
VENGQARTIKILQLAVGMEDEKKYLSDPTGWFTKKEHWSLNGA